MTWVWPVPNHHPWEMNPKGHDGAFGTKRRYDHHTGIDIYCPLGSPIHAVEAGTVIRVEQFTGEAAGSPWWNDTNAILVAGASGTVVYGEVKEHEGITAGVAVKRGQLLGVALKVMKHDKTRPMTMLHIELYEKGYTGPTLWWQHNEPQPAPLRDPTNKLRHAWLRVTDRFTRDEPKPPNTPEERKKLITWIFNHPLWKYPVKMKSRAPGQKMFRRIPGRDFYEMPEATGPEEIHMEGTLQECGSFDYLYVDPTTEQCSDLDWPTGGEAESAFRIRFEGGGWSDMSTDGNTPEPERGWSQYNKWIRCHDINLDCGAGSMEELLILIALRVKYFYGEGSEGLPGIGDKMSGCGYDWIDADADRGETKCRDAGDGFCVTCNSLMSYRCEHLPIIEGICPYCDEDILPPASLAKLDAAMAASREVYEQIRNWDDNQEFENEEMDNLRRNMLHAEDALKKMIRHRVVVPIDEAISISAQAIQKGKEFLERQAHV